MNKFDALRELYEQLAECTDSLKQIKDGKITSIAITVDDCLDDIVFEINDRSDIEIKSIGNSLQIDLKGYLANEERRLKNEIDKLI